jgi:hypothetical protein
MGFDLENLPPDFTDFFQLDRHPYGSQKYDSVKTFDKEFEPNVFFEKTILYYILS